MEMYGTLTSQLLGGGRNFSGAPIQAVQGFQAMKISDFFENTLGANLNNPRWSWGASNPTTNQLFLRVWKDQLETIDSFERITLLRRKAWAGKSPGFPERERHVQALRGGVEGYGVVCTAEPRSTPETGQWSTPENRP
jgi:hypothetical protein